MPTSALRALDPQGNVIPATPSELGVPPAASFWQAPSAATPSTSEPPSHGPTHPAPGACELTQSGLPGLTPEWGDTIARIKPISNALGQLLLACVDTTYYLNSWPLTAAVLINAQHPGADRGLLPGAQPIAADMNEVNLDAAHLSGRKVGNAWLVVRGGSDAAQLLRVLQALNISKLDLHQ